MALISGLTRDGDWKLGRGRLDYITKGERVRQKVVTRLRFFVNDWYANMSYGVDWVQLLGQRGNQNAIIREIERIVLNTEDVLSITNLEINQIQNRQAGISLTITTAFSDQLAIELEVEP